MSSAARLRDEVKHLKAVELAVIDSPTVPQSNIKDASTAWPLPRGGAAGEFKGRQGRDAGVQGAEEVDVDICNLFN